MYPAASDPPQTPETGLHHYIHRRVTQRSIRASQATTIGLGRRSRACVVSAIAALCLLGTAAAANAAVPVFTEAQGSPFPTGSGPIALTFDRAGSLLMTANQDDGTISSFSVSYPNGQLKQVSGSPFSVPGATPGSSPDAIAASPDSNFIAAANGESANGPNDTVSILKVGASGGLTPVQDSPFLTGRNPTGVAFSPTANLLAVTNFDDNTVSVFVTSPAGRLVPASGSPYSGPFYQPYALAFSPDGKLVAVANTATNTVSILKVAGDGSLTPVGSGAAVGDTPVSVAFNATGTLLATTSEDDDTVSLFSVAANGSLTPVAGSPFSTGSGSGPVAAAFSPDGALLATANQDNYTVSVFSVGPDGRLTPTPGTPLTLDPIHHLQPESISFSPDGSLLATANVAELDDSGSISVFKVSQQTLSTPPPGSRPGQHHPCCGQRHLHHCTENHPHAQQSHDR
jgi:6-phosphogluconolactonase